MYMLLFGKKEATWPPEDPQSNMVIKSLGSWWQYISLLRFQSLIVKDTKRGAQKWYEGTKQLIQAAKRAALQNQDLIGIATLVPQTNLPETPSYTEGETLKAKSEGFQEGRMGWFQKEGLLFLSGNSGSWLSSYMPPLI